MAHKSEMLNDVRYALDFEISADLTLKAMTAKEQEDTPPSAQERRRKIVEIAIKWLERYEKTTDTIVLEGGALPHFRIDGNTRTRGKAL